MVQPVANVPSGRPHTLPHLLRQGRRLFRPEHCLEYRLLDSFLPGPCSSRATRPMSPHARCTTVREQIGKVVGPDSPEQIGAAVAELVGDRDRWISSIRSAREANIYNVGRSGAVAADVIAEKADRYLQR